MQTGQLQVIPACKQLSSPALVRLQVVNELFFDEFRS